MVDSFKIIEINDAMIGSIIAIVNVSLSKASHYWVPKWSTGSKQWLYPSPELKTLWIPRITRKVDFMILHLSSQIKYSTEL